MLASLMFVLCATGVAPATPSTAAVLVRKTSLTAAEAQALAVDAATALVWAGLPVSIGPDAASRQLAKSGVVDTAACSAKRPCVAELGRQLGAAWVVAVSVSRVEDDRSVALELLKVADETVIEKDSILLPPGAKLTQELVSSFATRAARAVSAANEVKKPVDAPTVTPLTPVEAPPPLLVEAPPPAPRAHTASFVLGGVGVAALVASAVCLGLSLDTRASLANGTRGADGQLRSPLSGSAAQAKAETAALELTLAGVGAALGVGLGTAAVLTW